LLLAPEEGDGGTVVGSKKAIFDAAVVQAKVKLRSEGKTFIVGPDGVNPLTAVLQPVVTALNAPLLNGLEQALAGLGLSVEQIKMSRDPLKQLADGWCKKIMNAGADRTDIKWRRPKISVALGAEDYAAFIRRYNEGN
ncbi:MAG: hypothetical protein NTV49_10820, partial [Kiritimatiellaeota bacterium]|nr:hypothetical protein [Kiritimatiellota bacterium]